MNVILDEFSILKYNRKKIGLNYANAFNDISTTTIFIS